MTQQSVWNGKTELRAALKSAVLSAETQYQRMILPARALCGRLMSYSPRPPRFVGAYPTFEAAMEAVPRHTLAGYDHGELTKVTYAWSDAVAPWDYPVVYWLGHFLRPGSRVVDAGGRLATKYLAFGRLLPVQSWQWTILDLPSVVEEGRQRQADGRLPAELTFVARAAETNKTDLLLASGLLQYLDVSLTKLICDLPARPRQILLNYVATRAGDEVVTLELVGKARVPYRIRSRAELEAEIDALDYEVRDRWEIPEFSHLVATHPGLGRSRSLGYCLVDRRPQPAT